MHTKVFNSLAKFARWAAAACLEEHMDQMVVACMLIEAGCKQCPKSKDVWLEVATSDC